MTQKWPENNTKMTNFSDFQYFYAGFFKFWENVDGLSVANFRKVKNSKKSMQFFCWENASKLKLPKIPKWWAFQGFYASFSKFSIYVVALNIENFQWSEN